MLLCYLLQLLSDEKETMKQSMKITLSVVLIIFSNFLALTGKDTPFTARTAYLGAVKYAAFLGYDDVKATSIQTRRVFSLDTILVKKLRDGIYNDIWYEWNGLNYIWSFEFVTNKVSHDSVLFIAIILDSTTNMIENKYWILNRKDYKLFDTIPIGDAWIDSDSLGRVPRLSKDSFLRSFRLFKDYGSYVNVAMRSDGTETIWYMWDELDGLYTSYFANTGEVKTHGITSVDETTLTVGNTPLLSPNPITNGFTLSANIQATDVRLYSVVGGEVHVWNNCKDVQYFDTQHILTGVYTLRIQCENGSVLTSPVVITR